MGKFTEESGSYASTLIVRQLTFAIVKLKRSSRQILDVRTSRVCQVLISRYQADSSLAGPAGVWWYVGIGVRPRDDEWQARRCAGVGFND